MGSSILSEVDNPSISGGVSQTRQRFPLSWLPVSRPLPPRSGLERSDFVLWHKCEVPTGSELVCFPGQTGSDRCTLRTTRLTHKRHSGPLNSCNSLALTGRRGYVTFQAAFGVASSSASDVLRRD